MDKIAGEDGTELMYRSCLQYLLLEVANGVLVSVSEEIEDVVFDVVLLQVVHQMGTIALTIKRPERGQFEKQDFYNRHLGTIGIFQNTSAFYDKKVNCRC